MTKTATITAPADSAVAEQLARTWWESLRTVALATTGAAPAWETLDAAAQATVLKSVRVCLPLTRVSAGRSRKGRALRSVTSPVVAPEDNSAEDAPVEGHPEQVTLSPNRRNLCAIARTLAQISESDVRADMARLFDGVGAHPLPPIQVAEHARVTGWPHVTVSVVRNHRRRLTKTGEHCQCPR